MAKSGGKVRKLLVWTHERGTLQYDIICALILAFIFLMPRGCFISRGQAAAEKGVESSHTPPVASESRIP